MEFVAAVIRNFRWKGCMPSPIRNAKTLLKVAQRSWNLRSRRFSGKITKITSRQEEKPCGSYRLLMAVAVCSLRLVSGTGVSISIPDRIAEVRRVLFQL